MFVGASIRFLKKHPPKFRSIEMQPPKVWNAMPRFTGLWMIVVRWLTSPVIILEFPRFRRNFGVANNTIHADLKTELDAVRDQLLDMKRLLKCKDDPWAFCLLQAEKGVGAVAALAWWRAASGSKGQSAGKAKKQKPIYQLHSYAHAA